MNSNWKVSKLAELCEIRHGFAFKSKDFAKNADEALPIVLTPGNFRSEGKLLFNESNTKRCLNSYPKGFLFSVYELVVVMTDLSSQMKILGKPAIIDKPNILHNQRIGRFVFSEKINIHFVRYFLLTDDYLRNIKDTATGTMVKHTAPKRILDCKIPIPPLPEQKRIVKILDKAFAAIDKAKANAEKNLANAKELFESCLNGIFSNPGEDWEEKKLQDIVETSCTLSYGIVQPGNDFTNGLPVIRPTDLTNKFVHLAGLKLIDPRLADSYKRTTLIGKEILLCVRGNTGIISITTEELKGANVTRGIVPISFNSKTLSLQYGYYQLVSDFAQKQIKEHTYGTALMQINIRDLRKLTILIPPIFEQKRIVAKLDALSAETKHLEKIYRQKIADLEELKKTILKKAFEGKL